MVFQASSWYRVMGENQVQASVPWMCRTNSKFVFKLILHNCVILSNKWKEFSKNLLSKLTHIILADILHNLWGSSARPSLIPPCLSHFLFLSRESSLVIWATTNVNIYGNPNLKHNFLDICDLLKNINKFLYKLRTFICCCVISWNNQTSLSSRYMSLAYTHWNAMNPFTLLLPRS